MEEEAETGRKAHSLVVIWTAPETQGEGVGAGRKAHSQVVM